MTRYNDDDIIEQDGDKLYERIQPVELDSGDEVIRYKIKEDENARDIARILYKEAKLWWIISDVLNVSNPFEVLKLETNIVTLPTLKTVMERIL